MKVGKVIKIKAVEVNRLLFLIGVACSFTFVL